jgi:Ca2+-binding RTX toxin-like protein
VFLNDGIDSPVSEIMKTAAYLIFAKLDLAAAGGLIGLFFEAFGEVAPQFFGFEDPESAALLSSLLLTLDQNMTDDKLLNLLDAISLGDNAKEDPRGYGLEWLTRNIYQALHGNELSALVDKEAVYSAATDLISEISADPNINYKFTNISGMSANELQVAAKASTDLGRAHRYALVNLQPFLMTHTDTGALVPDALSEAYDRNVFSEQYLEDRALFLATVNKLYTTEASVSGHDLIEFWDRETGESVTQQATSDHVSQRYIFGSHEGDVIKGGGDDDHLYGGAGDDKLTGLAGADYMEGGEGDDTYIAGDGDIILDTDGFGRVIFDEAVLLGGEKSPNDDYTSLNGDFTFRLDSQTQTLTVIGPTGTLTIRNFRDGDLGISLHDTPADTDEVDLPGMGDDVTITNPNGDVYESLSNSLVSAPPTDPGLQVENFQTETVVYDDGTERTVYVATDSSGKKQEIFLGSRVDGDGNTEQVPVTSAVYNGQLSTTQLIYGTAISDFILADNGVNEPLASAYPDVPVDKPGDTGIGIDIVLGGEGNDTLNGNFGSDRLYGERGNDQLVGDTADDYLDGGSESDILKGGYGRDILIGGSGNDWLQGDGEVVDGVIDSGGYVYNYDQLQTVNGWLHRCDNDYLDGGSGDDTLIGGAGEDRLYGGTGGDWLYGDEEGAFPTGYDKTFSDKLFGGEGNDVLRGGSGADSLYGEEDNDHLYGEAGDDTLVGGGGTNHLAGGTGSDLYVIGNEAGYNYIVDDGQELSVIRFTGYKYSDVALSLGEKLTFSINNGTVRGEANFKDNMMLEFADGVRIDPNVEQTYNGSQGDDLIEGGITPDTITSGSGDDLIYSLGGNDTIDAGDGNDKIEAGHGDDSVVAGLGNDYVDAGEGDDQIYGGAGNDEIRAWKGDDYIDAGEGNDIAYGVEGDDTYFVSRTSGSLEIVDGSGLTTLLMDSGIDPEDIRIYQDAYNLILSIDQGAVQVKFKNYSLPNDFGAQTRIVFDDGTVLNGSAIDALVEVGERNDITGTAGDDVHVLDHPHDRVYESADGGHDKIVTPYSYALADHVEELELSGFFDVKGYGNDLDNTLIGNSGDNYLDGRDGENSLIGGAGDDYYLNGTPVEQPNEGEDTWVVHRKTTLAQTSLPDNVEHCVCNDSWRGMWVINGNDLDNNLTYTGDQDGVWLIGGAGSDRLSAPGYGDTTYFVGNPGDRISDGYGNDTVITSLNWSLFGTNLENLKAVGSAVTHLEGNDWDNVMDAADGESITLQGHSGDDIYLVLPTTTVVETSSGGEDTLVLHGFGGATFDLNDYRHFENVSQGSRDHLTSDERKPANIIGTDENNRLTYYEYTHLTNDPGESDKRYEGRGGDDYLRTGDGNDTLDGGTGNDILDGDSLSWQEISFGQASQVNGSVTDQAGQMRIAPDRAWPSMDLPDQGVSSTPVIDEDAESPVICVKPLPGATMTEAATVMGNASAASVDLQCEQLVNAMAGFVDIESSETVVFRPDDQRESVSLAVNTAI